MSQQDEGRPPARPRLVFSPEVHEQLKEQFERALMDHPHDEKAAMNSVIEWLWGNRDGEAPAAQAFRQLLDHFIKSAIAQAWIDGIDGTLKLEGGSEKVNKTSRIELVGGIILLLIIIPLVLVFNETISKMIEIPLFGILNLAKRGLLGILGLFGL
jgi:hypothetical protein